jgi:hypothetical protein
MFQLAGCRLPSRRPDYLDQARAGGCRCARDGTTRLPLLMARRDTPLSLPVPAGTRASVSFRDSVSGYCRRAPATHSGGVVRRVMRGIAGVERRRRAVVAAPPDSSPGPRRVWRRSRPLFRPWSAPSIAFVQAPRVVLRESHMLPSRRAPATACGWLRRGTEVYATSNWKPSGHRSRPPRGLLASLVRQVHVGPPVKRFSLFQGFHRGEAHLVTSRLMEPFSPLRTARAQCPESRAHPVFRGAVREGELAQRGSGPRVFGRRHRSFFPRCAADWGFVHWRLAIRCGWPNRSDLFRPMCRPPDPRWSESSVSPRAGASSPWC